jgi:hypothetical protein
VVQQARSAQVERWLVEDPEAVTWTLARVEVVSALRRLVREGELRERGATRAEELLVEVLRRTHVVSDIERAKEVSCRLLRVHALRAADALQLAAALAWADGAPRGSILYTFDRRLAVAAEREGFRVLPES